MTNRPQPALYSNIALATMYSYSSWKLVIGCLAVHRFMSVFDGYE